MSLSPKTSTWRDRAWFVLRFALGMLLLATAILKLSGRSVTAVPQIGWFATPLVQLAAIQVELFLGVWLLSGRSSAGAWLAALGTFVIFAGVSGYLGSIGQSSCGCFGAIKASPWHAFAVDVAALLALGLFRPSVNSLALWTNAVCRRAALPGAVYVLGVGGFMIAVSGAATAAYGSVDTALARLRGEAITIQPSYIDFGSGEPGQFIDRIVEVHNWTDQPVGLIGGTSDCSCVNTDSLPAVIPPSQSSPITIRMRIPKADAGDMTRTAELWTDFERQQTVKILITCRIRE